MNPTQISPSLLPPLFRAYPALKDRLPWLSIGDWPTPVHAAARFAARHALKALYVKREDAAHPICGGNKVRGLEFTLAEALRRGAGHILTLGSIGSHHIATTAWHARQIGLNTQAWVIRQPDSAEARATTAWCRAIGATYHLANPLTLYPRLGLAWLRYRLLSRSLPYYLPVGGTTPLACVGHVNAALELRQQIDQGILPAPDYIYVPLGSLGTAAGLLAGIHLAGLHSCIVGVVTSYRWYCTLTRWRRYARQTLALLRQVDPNIPDGSFSGAYVERVTTALGDGYARPSAVANDLAREMHDGEGFRLDETYTAKTLHGMMQFIAERRIGDRVHLLWDTYSPLPTKA